MNHTQHLKIATRTQYICKSANIATGASRRLTIQGLLKMLGLGTGTAGIGYGVGHYKGKATGYNEGAQVGQDSAMRNLVTGLYSTLMETANKGRDVSLPGLKLEKGVKHIGPAGLMPPELPAVPTVKASSQQDLFIKASFLSQLAGAAGRGITKGIGWVLRGAQPGQDAISQLMVQYQMSQQDFNKSPGYGFRDNFRNPFTPRTGSGGAMSQYGQAFDPIQMNANRRMMN
jgi:hypothetical protein